MSKKNSINAILNVIKSVMSLLFPLITFPYISRILGVENIGKINFSTSIVNYFILIAGLGISTFGIRECAKRRGDKKELSLFASQLFSFNIITAMLSYLILFLFFIFSTTMRQYYILIIIYAFQILLNTIGTDWINVALEEFKYITLRYIICQIISIIAMFLFIHTEGDYIFYAIISVIALSGANIVNFFHVRKFCSIRFNLNIPWKEFSKPILYIFIASLATTIYTNLDVTMLGYLKDDYTVGIYSCALKVYRILKQIMIAIIFVYEPRLSFMINQDKQQYNKMVNRLFNIMLTLLIPLVVGTICISKNAILLFAGEKFKEAAGILVILSISVIFSTIAYFIIHIIMLPKGKEKQIGIPTIIGALCNVIANSILIFMFGIKGAAIATVLAELSVLLTSIILIKNDNAVNLKIRILIKIFIGNLGIISCYYLFGLVTNFILNIGFTILFGIISYFIIEIIVKNEIVYEYYEYFLKRIKKHINDYREI